MKHDTPMQVNEFYWLFQQQVEAFRQRFGVSRRGLYVGWMPPMTRRIARAMARDKVRRELKSAAQRRTVTP